MTFNFLFGGFVPIMIGMAYAQAQGAANGGGMSSFVSLLPIALMILIFYFLLIRPQKKKEKDRQGMITSLAKGDKVLTSGGMYGTVDSFKSDEIIVIKIGGNTKVEFSKNSIQTKVT